MWKDLSPQWQKAYEQAWLSFRNGSIPIGAIITDSLGNVIIEGRNEWWENRYPNKRTAHAEMYCVRNLDIERCPDLKEYHLYTTMEPCPMCMGTIVMGGIRKLHVAAKDKYCGALHYLNYDPWMKGKNIEVHLEAGELELVQLAWQGYHELRRYDGVISKVLKKFQEDCPKAIDISIKMYEERYLDRCVEDGMTCAEVYDSICELF